MSGCGDSRHPGILLTVGESLIFSVNSSFVLLNSKLLFLVETIQLSFTFMPHSKSPTLLLASGSLNIKGFLLSKGMSFIKDSNSMGVL